MGVDLFEELESMSFNLEGLISIGQGVRKTLSLVRMNLRDVFLDFGSTAIGQSTRKISSGCTGEISGGF